MPGVPVFIQGFVLADPDKTDSGTVSTASCGFNSGNLNGGGVFRATVKTKVGDLKASLKATLDPRGRHPSGPEHVDLHVHREAHQRDAGHHPALRLSAPADRAGFARRPEAGREGAQPLLFLHRVDLLVPEAVGEEDAGALHVLRHAGARYHREAGEGAVRVRMGAPSTLTGMQRRESFFTWSARLASENWSCPSTIRSFASLGSPFESFAL